VSERRTLGSALAATCDDVLAFNTEPGDAGDHLLGRFAHAPCTMDVVALYQGAYGRTIRLATHEEATLQRLRTIFLQLAEGEHEVLELGATIFPSVDERVRIKIYAALTSREARKTLTEEPAANPPTFRWTQSKASVRWPRRRTIRRQRPRSPILDQGEGRRRADRTRLPGVAKLSKSMRRMFRCGGIRARLTFRAVR
jgi:hypothetical protein